MIATTVQFICDECGRIRSTGHKDQLPVDWITIGDSHVCAACQESPRISIGPSMKRHLVQTIRAKKQGLRNKYSWYRLIEASELPVEDWYRITSPITSGENGVDLEDRALLKQMSTELGWEPNFLINEIMARRGEAS